MEVNGEVEADRDRDRDRDRLSDLPDALKHEILSHLGDMKQVVHTSVLSNKWRYIWMSTPYLDFDLDLWLKNCKLDCLDDEQDAFFKFVNNFLTRTSSNIFKFRLYTREHDFDTRLQLVSSWIKLCLQRNVKQLTILTPLDPQEDDSEETLDLASFLPCNLFDTDVKEVIICFFCPDPLVTLPTIHPGSMLTSLRLHGVRLPDGDAHGELVLRCGVLQDLKMTFCDVNHLKSIVVSIPQVTKLWFRLCTNRETGRKVEVKIHAPLLRIFNLTTFSNKRQSPLYYSIEDDLLSIDLAYVYVYTDKQYDLLDRCSQSVVKILSRLFNVRDLHLVICSKQVLAPVLLDVLTHQFQNLRYLKLLDQIEVPCVQEILNFLLRFPCIDTLVWERSAENGKVSEEEELVANKPKILVLNLPLESLKTVEIRNLKGTDIELKFLAILLKRATVLDQLIIRYSWLLSSGKLTRFHEKVFSLPRASSNVSISFLEEED